MEPPAKAAKGDGEPEADGIKPDTSEKSSVEPKASQAPVPPAAPAAKAPAKASVAKPAQP